jgi:hypothetical protein
MRAKRDAGVEAQPKVASDKWVGQRPNILRRILKNVGGRFENCGSAQSRLAIYLPYRKPVMRFEPNPVVIDDGDNRNRNVKAAGGDCGDTIKGSIGRRIKNIVAPYGFHSLVFFLDSWTRLIAQVHIHSLNQAEGGTRLNRVTARTRPGRRR